MSVYLYVCLSVSLPACLSVFHLSACISVCLSACLSVCLSVCLPVCLSVCLSLCLSVCVCVCVCVCLHVYLSICLPAHLPACLPCFFLYLSLYLFIQVQQVKYRFIKPTNNSKHKSFPLGLFSCNFSPDVRLKPPSSRTNFRPSWMFTFHDICTVNMTLHSHLQVPIPWNHYYLKYLLHR